MNKYKFRFFILGSLLILASNGLYAANPILKNIGMSDPHVRVFNDTVYLFTGHDQTPQDKVWDMRYWQVFSSTNLVDWNAETTISPKDNYMSDNSKDCWAGDAAMRNGKYYFYFSDRNRSVGVMEAKRPDGTYKDALGHALMKPGHDPTLFVDDDADQTPYLVYGSNEIGGFHIAKLNNDMVSLAEQEKLITISGTEWNNAPKWQDKNYLFKYEDTYYLSWGRDYATSKNVYGPYESAGSVGDGYKLSEFAHGSFFWWKGQFYHMWCYYIQDGLKYRESIITYCHFDADGKIITDTQFLDKHFENGVGKYNANWKRIEAEWYYEKSSDVKKAQKPSGEFILSDLKNNSWIRFNKTTFNANSKFFGQLSCDGDKGSIEIRSGGVSGILLGTVDINVGEDQNVEKELDMITGEHDLYLVFKGGADTRFELDWFNFGIDTYGALPGIIEAEDYTDMLGFQTENTSDIGGGENIGYTAVGDWLEYNVDVANSGLYQFDFRVSALENNIRFKLFSNENLLVDINEPFTGDWQNWKTYSAQVDLNRGKQKLKLLATGERWNLNWMEFTQSSVAQTQNSYNFIYRIYPNPCAASLNLEAPTACSYRMFDSAGKIVASSKTETNKFNIPTSDLLNGIYLLEVNTKEFKQVAKVSIL